MAYQMWRGATRLSGEINGVQFKLSHGMIYATDPLEPDEVQKLANIHHIQMEIVAPAPVIDSTAEEVSVVKESLTVEEEAKAIEESVEDSEPVAEEAPEEPTKKQRGRPKKSAM